MGLATYADGNLNYSQNVDAYKRGMGTIGVSSGKWYFEVDVITRSGSIPVMGIGIAESSVNGGPSAAGSYAYHYTGQKYTPSLASYSGNSYGAGDMIGVAMDLDNGTVECFKNGTSQGTLVSSLPAGTYHPTIYTYGTHEVIANFGQRAFAYTPPTGFDNALNTANLPAPDIADGSDYFNTVLYTGDNTNQAITGVGFQPDLVWIKSRSNETDHVWQDAVRGAQKFIRSNSTTTELTDNGTITSFDSDGFTIGSGNTYVAVNNSGWTFAAWNWLASNTSGSSNTDGSITSTVSANPTAGFSIVTYTGTGANATVGHGLGVAPKMVIIKRREVGSNWAVYHDGFGPTKVALLDSGIVPVSQGSTYWQSTAPSDTVVTLGTTTVVNGLNGTYVAYCFAEVESYSKIGSFVGNGSADGPFIHTGFSESWLLIKNNTTAQGL